MLTWKFYLDELEVSEPQGFADIVLNISRDKDWHGVFFEASTSELGFYGPALEYLEDAKRSAGFAADVNFRAVADCGGEFDILEGKLDFRRYKVSCGTLCIGKIGVEMIGCTMKLRNRYDQKVDLDDTKAFDKISNLANYDGLNFEMMMQPQELLAAAFGYTDPAYEMNISQSGLVSIALYMRPLYIRELYANINQTQLADATNTYMFDFDAFSFPISPQVLFDDVIECFDGDFTLDVRYKGRMIFDLAQNNGNIYFQVVKWDGTGSFFNIANVVYQELLSGPINTSGTFEFDVIYNAVLNLATGDGLYAMIVYSAEQGSVTTQVIYDPETYFNLTANKACPATPATVSMVNEVGSRIVESITDMCLRMKSDYFGRTDSQPYPSATDGCGSLRVLTSGLKLRKAENPKHFLSLKEYFEGLKAIDNLGMGIEDDAVLAIPGKQWVRIEPVEYFYQDVEILRLPYVPLAEIQMDPTKAYSIIKIGYKKWETEGINGLDEFNSNKQFRTSLTNVDTILEAESNFIAGGYPIEQTRQLSYSNTGGADSPYDNDTFIVCVVRDAYGYEVEQGNISAAENIYSPATAYNWRIRPFYNLMRWWKSIAQSYYNLVNTTSKLFFSSGTGNLKAKGQLSAVYDFCKLENGPKAEDQDLWHSDFAEPSLPIYKAENISIQNYPLSLKEYNQLKANPNGYISVQCGTGEYVKAYIDQIRYTPKKGQASFLLKLKWV